MLLAIFGREKVQGLFKYFKDPNEADDNWWWIGAELEDLLKMDPDDDPSSDIPELIIKVGAQETELNEAHERVAELEERIVELEDKLAEYEHEPDSAKPRRQRLDPNNAPGVS
jgi:hypothetical protein